MKMNELSELLTKIDCSYADFVDAIMHYAKKNSSRMERLMDYLKQNPNANSSDVVRFVSEQPDFADDAAYIQVE